MTLSVLGGLTGLTASYLSMIENGKRSLDRYSNIVTLAAALGVPPSELAPGMPADPIPIAGHQDASEDRVQLPITGDVLRAWRRSRGWDKPEMARRLRRAAGNDPVPVHDALLRMVHRWEREGLRTERYELLYAAALGIEPDRLCLGSDAPPDKERNVPTLLRVLLTERHWQLFPTFEAKFRRAAAELAEREGEPRLRTATVSQRQFERWYAGTVRSRPYPDACRVLEHMFGYRVEQLLALAEDRPGSETGSAPVEDSSDLLFSLVGEEDDKEVMRRRAFLLEFAALAMIAQSDPASAGESMRQLLDQVVMSELRSAEDWEMACADHLHGLRTQPPAKVRNALAVDLLAIHRQLKTSIAQDNPELQRTVAALSTLYANVLTRLGDHGPAIHWWRTARAAADKSGDLELRLGVRATEAGHGLYGQRSLGTVLRLTQNAQQIAGSAPSLGLALVACSEAKALMLLGRHSEAVRTLNTYRDLAASAPEPTGIMPGYWKGDQLYFAENMVHAGVGDESRANEAKGYMLASANPDYKISTEVRLHDALCTVVNGGIDEGIHRATEILDSMPPRFRNQMTTETGKMVLRAVPFEQHQIPSVREFCEVLATTAPIPPAESPRLWP